MENPETYRKLLKEKESELLELQQISAESEKPISLEDPIGRLTRIDAIQRQQQALYTKERTANSLRQVREALERIDEGTYGVCTKCKSEIEHDRLEFMPESTLCTKCVRAMSR
ncbi:MAG: TraR/DksA family transcriptional regulator [Chitinispirillaceae bacterium]